MIVVFIWDVNFIRKAAESAALILPVTGLEPVHPKAVDFESTVSTNFTTLASESRLSFRIFFVNQYL